jgi:Protein of unknown function (DUF429)
MPAAGATERLRYTALVAEAARRRQSASAVATRHGHGTALVGPGPDYAACVAFLKSHGLGRPAPLMSHQAAGDSGVDGFPADWMVTFARVNEGEGGAELRLRLLPRFADVLCAAEAPAMIAVDIPIGLPAPAGRGGLAAENMVGPLPGERQSFAFSVPFATATQLTVLSCASNSDCAEFATRGNTKENRKFSGGEQRSTSGLER